MIRVVQFTILWLTFGGIAAEIGIAVYCPDLPQRRAACVPEQMLTL